MLSFEAIAPLTLGATAVGLIAWRTFVHRDATEHPASARQKKPRRPRAEPREPTNAMIPIAVQREVWSALGFMSATTDRSAVEEALRSAAVPPARWDDVRRAVYAQHVSEVIADFVLSDDEAHNLEYVRDVLGVDRALADEMYRNATHGLLMQKARGTLADERVTEADLQQLFFAAEQLRTTLRFDAEIEADLRRCFRYAQWEAGTLPSVDSPIALKSGETCHYVTSCQWYERRTVRERAGYAGFSYSLPIAKGLHYRIGNVKPVFNEREAMKALDSGGLVFTSQRVVFVGRRGGKSFPWASVASITPYSDGLEFARPSGAHPILLMPDAEEAGVMAAAILASA